MNKMKIVLIHGQNHKGSSYNIGRLIAEKTDGEKEITEFFLPRDLNHFCLGCCKCLEGDENCPFFGEKRVIMEAVENADLLIFTTPTYCMRASAPMKSFIDLTFTYWMVHRPRACMFSKKAVVVSTAAGQGTDSAIKDISNALFFWGVPQIETYGIAVQAMNWESVKAGKKRKIEKDTARIAKKLSSSKKPKVGFKTRFMFGVMASMQKSGMGSSPSEKEYWKEKGWLGRKRPWKE